MSKRTPILLGFILLALAIFLQVNPIESIQHWIGRIEDVAYDMQLRAKLLTHREPLNTSIAIVDIDDKSLEKEGRWPWPRDKLGLLIDDLRTAGAVVVVFDMLFPQIEDNIAQTVIHEIQNKNLITPEIKPIFDKIIPVFDNDAAFAKRLAEGDDVVGFSFLPENKIEGIIPKPLMKLPPQDESLAIIEASGVVGLNPTLASAVKNAGFVNAFEDEDGIIRRSPLLMKYQNNLYPSLALEAVRIYLLTNIQLFTPSYGKTIRLEGIQLGNMLIPTDEEAEVMIPFRGPSYTFPYYSATDVLNQKFGPDAFAGKIVFVGATATGLGDIKATANEKLFPGVEINATIADALLKNNFPIKPPWAIGAEVFFTIILGIILIFIFPYLGPLALSMCIILIPSLLIFANDWINAKTNFIFSIFIPLITSVCLAILNMVYGYLFETRERSYLKEIFGQYVPTKHIDEMMKAKGEYSMRGDDREMSVLFADIRSFTTISETLSASQIKEFLNDFLTRMTQVIFNYQGTIDKYIGDLVMAFWGAPLADAKHAEKTLYAALDMQKEIIQMNPTYQEHHWPDIQIGIGINSGIMSVGDMGSKFRRNYTVLGDPVNLASRVESLTKFYGVKIMTTENTKSNQENIVFRLLDKVRVKGKSVAVEIYEVVCRKNELSKELEEELKLHHEAMQLYFQQQWDQAKNIFIQLKDLHPQTKIYILYLERLEEYLQHPPEAGWDGVYTHKTK